MAVTLNQNEFYTDLANLLVDVRINNTFDFYNDLVANHIRPEVTWGDSLARISVDTLEAMEYTDTTKTLLSDYPSKQNEQILTTTDRIFFAVDTMYEIGRGAFANEYGLSSFLSYVIAMLEKSMSNYYYEKVTDSFMNWTPTLATQTVTINGLFDTSTITDPEKLNSAKEANAKLIYATIMNLSKVMVKPSRKYNSLGYNATLPISDSEFIVNSQFDTDFNIDVMASLFNSGLINENQVYGDKIILPSDKFTGDNAKTIGWLGSKDAYIVAPRIRNRGNFWNPRAMKMTDYLHSWSIRGFVDGYNLVKIVQGTTVTPPAA